MYKVEDIITSENQNDLLCMRKIVTMYSDLCILQKQIVEWLEKYNYIDRNIDIDKDIVHAVKNFMTKLQDNVIEYAMKLIDRHEIESNEEISIIKATIFEFNVYIAELICTGIFKDNK